MRLHWDEAYRITATAPDDWRALLFGADPAEELLATSGRELRDKMSNHYAGLSVEERGKARMASARRSHGESCST